ncbi:MAG: hypothetical protein HY096_06400 [Nitrospinae bacterium]|nr:hypothetical protein [Nitrospinota bacterium]
MRREIEVVITFHPKDWATLPWCIWGIRRNIQAGSIYIISRKTEKQRLEALGLIFIDEDAVVHGLTVSSFGGGHWGGHYFQQVIKLGMADFVKGEYYLVVDADTVFLRKVAFFRDGKPIYATSPEYTPEYFESFYNLLGFHPHREFSFITHHMVFSRAIVKEMITSFKSDNNEWWYPIIQIAAHSPNAFSEFETYGHYIKARHKNEFAIRNLTWRNVPIHPSKLNLFLLSLYYDYCSFHAYMRINSNRDLMKLILRKIGQTK